ncbi:uncharacterized protein RCO7_10608 [Rhynchosporium graminicola]|uniref:Low-affinity potassium transport protein n=1 Tax=Rhynchosporium graminicola TaxID=2792576 RepID=A0A1E1LSU5_9HELO|nr:uncharacterized protein RCO7_10608 [Rhynchosporium commune]
MEAMALPSMASAVESTYIFFSPFVDFAGKARFNFTSVFSKTYEYLSGFPFIALHWLAFLSWSLISSIIIWLSQGRVQKQRFLTCLFFAISAITTTGLAPANVSSLNTFQQILLCINFILGSQPFTGIVILTVRKTAMEDAFGELIEKSRDQTFRVASLITQTVIESSNSPDEKKAVRTENPASKFWTDVEPLTTTPLVSSTVRKTTLATNLLLYWNNFLNAATVGRNSDFYGLTKSERETVVCVEYRAIKLLRLVVTMYIVLHQFLGAISLALHFNLKRSNVIGRDDLSASLTLFRPSTNNAGMSLMNDSMIPFKIDAFPVFIMSYLMLAGNTGFPIFLRLILWVMLKSLPHSPRFLQTRATLEYTLKYPRRVYTHLFPKRETLFLLLILMCMNAVDLIAFEFSARHLPEVQSLSEGYRVLDGMFQTLSVRCSGFNIVSISALPCALLMLYIGMMYVSAFPVTITIRTSNVYEERSLGVYTASSAFQADDESTLSFTHLTGHRSRLFFMKQQLSSQISYDAWSIMLALVIIGFVQGGEHSSSTFPIFPVIFEVLSAYANIGLSMGVNDKSYALCGSWKWPSQAFLMFLMLRGRHRSLPVSIDRAIQLPDRKLGSREEADEREREHELVREMVLAAELKVD